MLTEGQALVGQPDQHRAAVTWRALLDDIAAVQQLLQIVSDVRACVVALLGQITYRDLLVLNISKDQCLNGVDVIDAQPLQLEADNIEKATVQPLDQPGDVDIDLNQSRI